MADFDPRRHFGRLLAGWLSVGLTMAFAVSAWAAPVTLSQSRQLASRSGIKRDEVLSRLISGQVEWQQGKGAWKPLGPDTVLHAGDQVRTAENAILVLELAMQAGFVHVLGGSQLAVSDLKQLPGAEGPQESTFTLNNGKAYLRLRKFNRPQSRFRIETPGGAVAVRGTEFVVGVDAQQVTTTGVATGAVDVTAQSTTVAIRPGQMTTIVPGQPPTPPKLIPQTPIRLSRFFPANGSLQVTGTAGIGSQILINGIAIPCDPAGNFDGMVPLAADATEAVVEALDQTGHLESLTVTTSGEQPGK